jgi:ankyrin repeat protein
MFAATNGHLETVRYLLDKGANINLQDKLGRTALILATSENLEAVVKLLLDKGADAKIANSSGRTAKDIAESEGFAPIVTLLQAK